MLIEIQSDVFKCKNIQDGKVSFHQGLNTIIGYNNSVGKSLLLFAIDFAYGGEDYSIIDQAMIENIGHHEIKFTHDFNGILHTYLRSTDQPDIVKELRNNQVIKHWTIEQYRKYLYLQLNDTNLLLSFRELIGPFSRINLKNSNQVVYPMYFYNAQKPSNQVECLLKTYHIYEKYMNERTAMQNRKSDLSKYVGARELKIVETIDKNTRIEYEKRIEELKKLKNELKAKYSDGLITLDELQLDNLKELRKQLKALRRQKTVLEAKKNDIILDMGDLETAISSNYNELKRFFPNNNFKELDDVISYAKKLIKITKNEKIESINEIDENLFILNENILELENEIKKIIPNKKIPTSILDDYAKIDAEILAKENAIKKEMEFEKYKLVANQSEDTYKKKLQQVIPDFVEEFNMYLKLENDSIFSNLSSPVLEINANTASSYSLHTEADIGNASTTRGLIIFDILALKKTCVPYLIHDGFITNAFVNENLVKILNYYVTSCETLKNKQVFLCLEKADTYKEELKEIAFTHKIIELDLDDKSLYGRAWNKSK